MLCKHTVKQVGGKMMMYARIQKVPVWIVARLKFVIVFFSQSKQMLC